MANTRRWFHPHIVGKDAEDLLLAKGQDGSFLVRPSQSNPRDFTLSVRRGSSITHVKIQSTEEFYDLYGGEKFATLAELIEYYTDNPNTLKEVDGKVISLKHPMYTEEVTNQRWYHGIMSGKDAERLLLTKGQIGSFLVRGSVHSPGAYVLTVKKDEKEVSHIKINCTNNMYDVGGGQKFKSLDALVETYKQAPMVEASGSVVRLKQPVNATRFISGNIHERISDLMKIRSETYGKTGFWEEFEQLQQQECKNLHSRKEGSAAECRKKNRYKNILPFDYTRVKLLDGDPEVAGSDYINANYIADGSEDPQYIATQGCVPDTVDDFWRMMYQENTRVIVMTTNIMERGKIKCQRYWPDVQTEKRYGQLLVQTMSEEKKPHYILRELQVQKLSAKQLEREKQKQEQEEESQAEKIQEDSSTQMIEEEGEVDNKELKTEENGNLDGDVDNKDDDNDDDDDDDDDDDESETRTIYHYHFTVWPDHGVPQDPARVLDYLEDVNQKQRVLKELELEPGPVVVHCSAGIGRTGTFIVIDMLLRKIELEGLECEIDIQKTILSVRSQRSGMVQTEAQYKFIYMALSHHIQTLKARSRVGDNYDNRTYPVKTGTSSVTASSLQKLECVAAQQPLYTNLEYKSKEQNGSLEAHPPLPPKS